MKKILLSLSNSVFRSFVLIITLGANPTLSQDYDKGVEAYEAGRYAAAIREWTPLADQGDFEAQIMLGNIFYYKNGIQNYQKAFNWFTLAAMQGSSWAQYMVGLSYETGNGPLEDNVRAHMWYNISSTNGELISSIVRKQLKRTMSAEAIEQAQSMARECISSNYMDCGW